MLLSAYLLAMRCPVLIHSACYYLPTRGTDIAYAAVCLCALCTVVGTEIRRMTLPGSVRLLRLWDTALSLSLLSLLSSTPSCQHPVQSPGILPCQPALVLCHAGHSHRALTQRTLSAYVRVLYETRYSHSVYRGCYQPT
eukprot:3935814-Rhodomonas_salina.3